MVEGLDSGFARRGHIGQCGKSLRRVMAAGGFKGIDNEWWHFDMLDRQHVRRHFIRVE
jgi:D-alanyl-D-alanine dipeptidase